MRGERVCALLALISLSLPAAAQADCDFSAADAAMQGLLAADGIADGGLVIGSARGI